MAAWRGIFLLLRGVGWALLVVALGAGIVHGYARLRLGEHRLPGVSELEQKLLWDKDDFYDAEGRRYLSLCGWALEMALASALAAGVVLAVAAASTD